MCSQMIKARAVKSLLGVVYACWGESSSSRVAEMLKIYENGSNRWDQQFGSKATAVGVDGMNPAPCFFSYNFRVARLLALTALDNLARSSSRYAVPCFCHPPVYAQLVGLLGCPDPHVKVQPCRVCEQSRALCG